MLRTIKNINKTNPMFGKNEGWKLSTPTSQKSK
jgi:hypothetical protein